MRFHQVREVVDWAMRTHERLADEYEHLGRQCGDERLRMALSYLARHERSRVAALARYAADPAHEKVLATWFDDTTEFPQPRLVDRLCDTVDGQATHRLLASALAIHQTMEDLYQHRAETAAIDDQREFFSALARSHEAETRHLVRDMGRLEML